MVRRRKSMRGRAIALKYASGHGSDIPCWLRRQSRPRDCIEAASSYARGKSRVALRSVRTSAVETRIIAKINYCFFNFFFLNHSFPNSPFQSADFSTGLSRMRYYGNTYTRGRKIISATNGSSTLSRKRVSTVHTSAMSKNRLRCTKY